MRVLSGVAGLLLAFLSILPAQAQNDIFSELRLGVLAHDVPVTGNNDEPGADINAELRFTSPDFLRFLFSPRPHIGISINTRGNTDQLYAGLTFDFTLFRNIIGLGDRLFFEIAGGGALHDGKLDGFHPDRKRLGTRFLFRGSVEVGYAFNERHSLSLMFDHVSNADLGDPNEGMDSLGLRYGYRF